MNIPSRTQGHKLMAIFVSILLFASCASEHHPLEAWTLEGTCWTDNYEFFVGSRDTITHDSSLFLFMGGNLHEGGYGFALRQLAFDTFIICPIPGTPMVAVGVVDDTVVLTQSAEGRMLVCFRPDDPEQDTLYQFFPGDKEPIDAFRILLVNYRLKRLGGTYTDPKSGMRYEFVDSTLVRTPANGIPDTQGFHLFFSFDMPTQTIVLGENEMLHYEFTPEGIDLYKAHMVADDDEYLIDNPLCKLVRQM